MVILIALLYLAGGIGLGIEPGSTDWWWSRPVWIAVLLLLLLPVALLISPLERRSRGTGSSIPSSFRQVVGAMMFCLGSLFGFGGGPLPGLDIASFVLVLAGAGLSGVLPGIR